MAQQALAPPKPEIAIANKGPKAVATASCRVGIVEIGSRAIRLLVADVSPKRGLSVVATRVADVQLMDAVLKGQDASERELAEALRAVDRLRRLAVEMGAEKVCAFGTEAVRQLAAVRHCKVALTINNVDALDPFSEAECSFHAAIMGLVGIEHRNVPILVVDQGAGSTELILGTRGTVARVSEFASIPMGGNNGLDVYRKLHFDKKKFIAQLDPSLDELRLNTNAVRRTIVQGSVVTKCAWLRVILLSGHVDRKYDPRAVHGEFFTSDSLMKLVEFVDRSATWKAWLNRESPSEFDKVRTGVAILGEILNRLQISEFYVSASGTRHGMAWRLGLPN